MGIGDFPGVCACIFCLLGFSCSTQSSVIYPFDSLKDILTTDPHEAEVFAHLSTRSQIHSPVSGSSYNLTKVTIVRHVLGPSQQNIPRNWLYALIASCGLCMDDEAVRQLLLTTASIPISANGASALVENRIWRWDCKDCLACCVPRHPMISNMAYWALTQVGIPSVKENHLVSQATA